MSNIKQLLIISSLLLAANVTNAAQDVKSPTAAQPVIAPAPMVPDAPTAKVLTEEPAAPAVTVPAMPSAVPAAPDNTAKPIVQQEEPLAPAAKPEETANVLAIPTEQVVPELPKADPAVIAKIADSFNNGHFDQLAAMFSGEGKLVTANDEKAEAASAKGKLEAMKNMISGSKMSMSIDQVTDITPGVATFSGRLTTSTVEGKTLGGSVTGTLKYDSHEWKIVSLHFSSKDVAENIAEKRVMEESNPMTQNSIFAFMGVVAGFILARLFRRKAPEAAPMGQQPMMGSDANHPPQG